MRISSSGKPESFLPITVVIGPVLQGNDRQKTRSEITYHQGSLSEAVAAFGRHGNPTGRRLLIEIKFPLPEAEGKFAFCTPSGKIAAASLKPSHAVAAAEAAGGNKSKSNYRKYDSPLGTSSAAHPDKVVPAAKVLISEQITDHMIANWWRLGEKECGFCFRANRV